MTPRPVLLLSLGLAVALGAGCARDRLLFQSHADTPAWVQAPPPPAAGVRYYVGHGRSAGRFDETAARTAARDDVERQLLADVRNQAQAPRLPAAVAGDVRDSLADLAPAEVYWEQWLSQPFPLMGDSSVYEFHLLFGIPLGDLDRWARAARAATSGH